MGCGTSFVKYVLFFFNLIVALLGLALVGLGVAVMMDFTVITKSLVNAGVSVAPWFAIVIGSIMFVIAFFGCCGAIRESHCMVVTYAIFLLVIIILQVVMAVLMFTYSQNIEKFFVESTEKIFDQRRSANDQERIFSERVYDDIQTQFQCCGKTSPRDYDSVTLPQSCCTKNSGVISNVVGSCVFTDANEGCSPRIGELIRVFSKAIAGVAIGVACVEVVGALFALCLANSIRNMDRRYA